MTSVDHMLARMREQRKLTQERLKGVDEKQMLEPTTYGERDVNVRFLFYRLIAHEIEHTVQMAKTLQAIGVVQGEAQLILKNLQSVRGELEGMLVGLTDDDLDRELDSGEWSVRQVIEHILKFEESYGANISTALNNSPIQDTSRT